jgi:bifunctional non-homologous end joining protein LigD
LIFLNYKSKENLSILPLLTTSNDVRKVNMSQENATTISLRCTTGGRNAEYHAQMKEFEGGYVIVVQYGAIGATLQTTMKPAKPVSLEKAQALMATVLKEKMGKGYVVVGCESPMQQVGTNQQERSGHLPQLLNSVDESELQFLLNSPDWCMQEKMDGKRIALEISGSSVKGINKLGLYCSLPGEVVNAALNLGLKDAIIDGELIGQTFFTFDLIEKDGVKLQNEPYGERHTQLYELLVDSLGRSKTDMTIRIVDFAHMDFEGEKSAAFEAFKDDGAEGVVFKKINATYKQGRPNSGGDQLKYKFTESVSAICSGANGEKRSVSLALVDETGCDKFVGNVTIPVNHAIPKDGEVVEVRYLYYFKGGSLFQPVYLGVRDDVLPNECVIGQITRFKS